METPLKHNINHFHIRFTSESRNRFCLAEKWMKTRALSGLSQRQSKAECPKEASKLWHCMLIFWVSVIFCNNAFILSLSDVVQMHRMTLMCESWEKKMKWNGFIFHYVRIKKLIWCAILCTNTRFPKNIQNPYTYVHTTPYHSLSYTNREEG